MSRLIDADDLIELLQRKRKTLLGIGGNTYSIKAFDYIIARIADQPTAYDVEKVVADLEGCRQRIKRQMKHTGVTTYLIGKDDGVKVAIEYVHK